MLAIDCRSFGGQAGASARIENYLGFPTGISGMALMGRAFSQAQKFGVEMAIPDEAVKLECGNDPCHARLLATGERVQARAVVIATGARYRRLGVERLDEFEGTSVHYWASPLEADLCAGQEVALVGGGNSAGQAAVFLAGRAQQVTLLARRPLERDHVAISGRADREPAQCRGRDRRRDRRARGRGRRARRGLLARPRVGHARRERPVRHLFSFIGAEPNTDWLAGSGLKLDARGFVLTGDECGRRPLAAGDQPPRRVRGRRRARRLGQARRGRGRRRRAGRRRDPRLSRQGDREAGQPPIVQQVVATV